MFFLENLDFIAPLCTLVFFLFKKTKAEGAFFWFIAFVFSLFLFNFSSTVIPYLQFYLFKTQRNNLLIYHFGCIAYVFTIWKFFSLVLKMKSTKYIDIVFIIPFIILSIYNFIYLKRTFTIYGLTSIWVVVKCLTYYTQMIASPTQEDILHSRNFWIVSGLFMYFAAAFLIFISYDFITIGFLTGTIFNNGHIWLVHHGILAISCCFYAKAIQCKG